LSEVANNSVPAILVMTDGESLSQALTRTARLVAGSDTQVYSITYAESPALLTLERVEKTEFFILELFRRYPGGQRAEGVVLAERWRYRKPFLIVSPLHLAHQIQCPGYWDTAAKDSLVERIRHILSFPERCKQRFDMIQEHFGRMLTLPPQH
jgi:hypothetical protein